MGLRQSVGYLIRRDDHRFLTLLLRQADSSVEALDLLVAQRCGTVLTDTALRHMEEIEDRADQRRRELIDELQSSFATPFDREDVFALSRAVDDIVDAAQETFVEMDVYRIPVPPFVDTMAACLRDGARHIRLAMAELLDHPRLSAEHAVRAKRSENRMDTHYYTAVSMLVDSDLPTRDVLKSREIYRHLKNSADRIDRAADQISIVVIKHL